MLLAPKTKHAPVPTENSCRSITCRKLLSRLAAIWLTTCCSVSVAAPQPAATGPSGSPQIEELRVQLAPLLDKHMGQVAVAIKHVPSGQTLLHNAQQVMPTASLIKFPLMVATYQAIANGRTSLDAQIVVRQEDLVPGSGVLTDHFAPGVVLRLRDAIRLMIVFSDNTATNLVVDQVGLGATAELMQGLGLTETKLNSKVYQRETSIFPERSQSYGLGSTTAEEMLKLLEMLDQEQLVSTEASREMAAHLYACDDKSKLCRLLPGVKIAHKSGSINATRCDAGWIDGPGGRVLICVLTTDNADKSWGDDNAGELLCARIAQTTYAHFNAVASAVPALLATQEDATQPLHLGSQGILVEGLQRTLNGRNQTAPPLAVDGDFGGATQAAVLAFQRANNLTATGVVDVATWQALGPMVEESAVDVPLAEASPQLTPADSLTGPPLVSCKAWAIMDAKSESILWSSRGEQPLHPASTTKIMTAYLACRILEQSPSRLDERVQFSERADQTVGSSATVRAGEQIVLHDLLYGLLLPSGNDAAVAIAEHLGKELGSQLSLDTASAPAVDSASQSVAGSYDLFIDAMNAAAAELGMATTHYVNPHGLTNDTHLCSAQDLCKLTASAARLPLFRKIIATPTYSCLVDGPSGYQRKLVWNNTNRLLQIEGFSGAKTGTTDAAGACLVGLGQRGDRELIIVVLGATSSDGRYLDARNLFRWAWLQLDSSAL